MGTGATALSCCRRADLGWIFRKKFFNPRKNQSVLLWISHKLRFSDLLQLWFVWCWVGFCTYSSKHHPQNIYPELFSVRHWILLLFIVAVLTRSTTQTPFGLHGQLLSVPFPQPVLDSWLLAWLCPESQPPQLTEIKKCTESSLTFYSTFLFPLILQNNIPSEPSLG